MTRRCVVFDVDDTLYLEHDYVLSGLSAVAVHVARPEMYDAMAADFLAGRRGDLLDRGLTAVGIDPVPELLAALVDLYRCHEPAVSLLPDARRALISAAAGGHVAVVTDGPAASQRAKVRALQLARWADPVVLTAEGFRSKPDLGAFLHVERVLGAQGADCTYVADNPLKDFAGPAALGWRTVRVRRIGGLHADVASGSDVDREVASLDELDDLVTAP